MSRDPLPRFRKLFPLATKNEEDGERASARRRVAELIEKHESVNWTDLVPRAHRSWAFSPLGPSGEDCRTCHFQQSDRCFRYPPLDTDRGAALPPVYLGLTWCGEWKVHPESDCTA